MDGFLADHNIVNFEFIASRIWKRPLTTTPTDDGPPFRFGQFSTDESKCVLQLAMFVQLQRLALIPILFGVLATQPPAFSQQRQESRESKGERVEPTTDNTPAATDPQVQPVIEEPSLVSLFDWTLRLSLDRFLIQDLPLRGFRSFDQLALLANGVVPPPFSPGQGPAVGIGVGPAGQFSVNGFRGRSNNFTVDGSDNNDEDIGMRRQGFVALAPQTIESVQDFQIQTAGFLGEFGRNQGSMVNVVSQSGTREHHGSAYGAFSDDALGAGGFFDRSFSDLKNSGALDGGRYSGRDFSQQIYGGVLGGPILPRKLFYFVSAEHQRFSGTQLGHFAVPSDGSAGAPNERGLRINSSVDSPSGIPGFIPIRELETFFQDRFVPIPYSDAAGVGVFGLYPLPNNNDGPFGPHTYSQAKLHQGDGSILSSRLDWLLSSIHSFSGRYNFTQDETLIPFTGDAINSSVATDTRTQNISLFLNSTWTGSANFVRFSFGRTRLRFPPEKGSPLLFGSPCAACSDPVVIETSYGTFGPFGATGPVGQLTISPYSTVGVDVYNFPQGRVDNTFQLGENFSWIGLSHSLQTGFEVRFSQLNSFADRNSRPAYLFANGRVDSLDCGAEPGCLFRTEDLLLRGTDLAALGAPAAVLQTLATGPVPDSTLGLRISQYEAFLQDSWRIGSNLTINLGLRYEFQTVPVDENGRIEEMFSDEFLNSIMEEGNDAWNATVGALQGFLDGRDKIYDSDRDNLAPRIGLAWDPVGDGKTAVRAGLGFFYDANLGAVASQSRNVFPTFVPINLEPNFQADVRGSFLISPIFLEFAPTGQRLVREGTLNSYNLDEVSLGAGLGSLFAQSAFPDVDPLLRTSNGLAFTLPEKELKSSYGRHLVVSAERQFGNLLASLSYVGTRGFNLTRFATPNGGWVSTPVLFFPADPRTPPVPTLTVLSETPHFPPTSSRPRTDLGAYTVFENTADSSYHSLQASLGKRLGRSLQFRAGWTWSHAIDDVSDPFDSRGFFALPQDTTRPDLERASASFDARHRLSGFFRWELPQGRSGPIFREWRLSAIAELQTGQPFSVTTAWDLNRDGNLTDRPPSSEGIEIGTQRAQSLRLDADFETIHMDDLDRGGKLGRNTFRADGIANLDLALSRRFPLRREASLDFRLELFNLLNHTSFGIPIRVLESPGFGNSFDTQIKWDGARSLRLGVRFSF